MAASCGDTCGIFDYKRPEKRNSRSAAAYKRFTPRRRLATSEQRYTGRRYILSSHRRARLSDGIARRLRRHRRRLRPATAHRGLWAAKYRPCRPAAARQRWHRFARRTPAASWHGRREASREADGVSEEIIDGLLCMWR